MATEDDIRAEMSLETNVETNVSEDGFHGYFHQLFPYDFFQHCDHAHQWTVVLAAAVLVLFLVFRKSRQNQPPGPWPWPVIGHVNYFTNRAYIKLSNLKDSYGDVYKLRVGNYNVVVACSLDAVLEGLIHKGVTFSSRPDFESLHDLYGGNRQRGLGTTDFNEKAQMKKHFVDSSLDAYCSTSDNIEDMVGADILDVVNVFVESEQPMDPFFCLESACLNIMTRLTYGRRSDPVGRAMQEMLGAFHSRNMARNSFHAVDFVPFLKAFSPREDLPFVREKTANQIEYQSKILNVHKDSYDPGSIRDMIDHLLLFLETGEDRGTMEKSDIDYLLLDFVNSGYEATAVVLTWLLGYMAMNPEIQKQVQQELDGVVGNDRLPSLQDQPFLPYTSAVIFEAERLASVYPFLHPHVASEDSKLQGYDISEDTIVLFNVWSIHHDARYWKHPMKFDPHRFLTEEKVLDIPDHFVPYGAGPRRCPGESLAEINLFLFFATIMHQLTVSPTVDNFHMVGEFDFLIRPVTFKLAFTERES